jgi:hypothetical protein
MVIQVYLPREAPLVISPTFFTTADILELNPIYGKNAIDPLFYGEILYVD